MQNEQGQTTSGGSFRASSMQGAPLAGGPRMRSLLGESVLKVKLGMGSAR